jgi:cytoskeletal protein CcmA (bactofilin family)
MKSYIRFKLIILMIALLLAFGVPAPARAQGIVYGDTIPTGTTVDQDIVLIGQNILIDGTVNGNVFVLGNQIQINGEVNGSLVLIGQNISISGKVSGSTYAVALTLELIPGAGLGRDLYILSVGLASGTDTSINRDLFAIGLDAGLNGSVGRDLHTAIGPIQLYNGLMRLLGFEELTVELHFELPQPAPESEAGPSSHRQLPIIRARTQKNQSETEDTFDWGTWSVALARDWVILSLFGLLAIWLTPRKLEGSKGPLLTHPWKTTGIGLLALVVATNLFVVAILLGTIIFSIGLALNYIQLWQLSIIVWITSYSLLALAVTALWIFLVYGAKIIVVYILFSWLIRKLTTSNWTKILAILVGTLIYVLLRSVPMVGWVIGVLVTAVGIGTAWLAYRDSRKSTNSLPKHQKKKTT